MVKQRRVSVRAFDVLKQGSKRGTKKAADREEQDDALELGDIEAMLSDDDPLKHIIQHEDSTESEAEEPAPKRKRHVQRLAVMTEDKKWTIPQEKAEQSSSDDDESIDENFSKAKKEGKKESIPQTLEEKRSTLASLCLAVTENPQANLALLTRIRKGWSSSSSEYSFLRDPEMAGLALASLVALFVDVLPGYPVRKLSAAELGDRHVSRDVRQQRAFEQGLLHHYEAFLRTLRDALGYSARELDDNNGGVRSKKQAVAKVERGFLGSLMAPLATRLGHFNHASVVLGWAVREVLQFGSTPCISAIKELFAMDGQGDATLQGVRVISNTVHDCFFGDSSAPIWTSRAGANASLLLETLLSVNLRSSTKGEEHEEPDLDAPDVGGRVKAKREDALRRRYRTKAERKAARAGAKRERASLAAEVTVTASEKAAMSAQSLRFLFRLYFELLSSAVSQAGENRDKVLPVVFRGIARFAGYLSREYLGEMLHLMRSLVANEMAHLKTESSTSIELGVECIACVVHCQRLTVDQTTPMDIKFVYDYCYGLLKLLPSKITADLSKSLMAALRSLFARLAVPVNRVAAFCHRLAAAAAPGNLIFCLDALVMLLREHPQAAVILSSSNGNSNISASSQAPWMADPDLGNAKQRDLDLGRLKRVLNEARSPAAAKKLLDDLVAMASPTAADEIPQAIL